MNLPIINECSKLPSFALWHIRKSRQWIPPFDLVGIEFIRLLNKCPEPPKNAYENLKKAYREGILVQGMYIQKTNAYPAEIHLFLDDIYFAIPRYAYFSPVPTLVITQILAHEVAHHLVRTRGYIFTPDEKYPSYAKKPAFEEEMANRYAFNVVSKMKKKMAYKLGGRLMHEISGSYYVDAMMEWRSGKYKEAADYWYRSFLLNPDWSESAYWYWRSLEKYKNIEKAKMPPESSKNSF